MKILTNFIVIGTALLVVWACEQITGYADMPRMIFPPTRDRVVLTVQWEQDIDKIGRWCGRSEPEAGCTRCFEAKGEWYCTVLVQAPTDFNDTPRLAYLGHEVFHALGAVHANP